MNYSAAYDDIINAFGIIAQQDIADAIGVLVVKNIIVQHNNVIKISTLERSNILIL